MPQRKILASGLMVFALAGLCTPAAAVLNNVTAGLQATGKLDLDGIGPQPPFSGPIDDTELTLPFTRSVVSVTDDQSGLFAYSASADIGTLALRVAGSLTNATAAAYFGQGVPILQSTAQALDVITLTSSVAGIFPVEMQLMITGTITPSANVGFDYVSANSQLRFSVVNMASATDSGRYTSGAVADTLSVVRSVEFATAGASVDMAFDAFLSLNIFGALPGETVSGQLSNTALLNLVLPAGVSVTGSASGTYGVPIAAIPEPRSFALMLAGLALTSLVVQRRRRIPSICPQTVAV